MNKKTAIILGALLLLSGGAYVIIKKRKENGLGGSTANPENNNDGNATVSDITENKEVANEKAPTVKLGDPINSGNPTPNASLTPEQKEEQVRLEMENAKKEAYARKLAESGMTASRSVTTQKKGCYKSNLGEECCYQPSGDVRCTSISEERVGDMEMLEAPMRAFSDFDGDSIDEQILEID